MTKTNQYGQPVDVKQHVLKTRELIAAEVRQLFEKRTMSENDGAVDPDLTLFDTDELIKDLAAYVIDYASTDWGKNVRHGVALGRKDARVMLTALLNKAIPVLHVADEKTKKVYSETPSNAIPVTELKKVITALQEGQA